MVEVTAVQAETPQIVHQLKALIACLLVGILASVLNVYLQFVLDQCFRADSPIFIRNFDDGVDWLFASTLYFSTGLACFGMFLHSGRSLYKLLPLNAVAAIFVITYAYSAYFWFSHWNFGFEHWAHIAMMQVCYIVASTIHPICLAAMYVITLSLAKLTQKNFFSTRDGITLIVLTVVSLFVWFNFYGTFAPYFGPASAVGR